VSAQQAAPASDRVVTAPNALSLLRLLGVPLFLWLALGPHADGWAIVVLAVSSITDWLDGKLARLLNQTSRIGQLLDPAADRLYIVATVIALGLRDIMPWWLAGVLLGRDVALLGFVPVLKRLGYGSTLPVHFFGKAATFNLLYALPLLLLGSGSNMVSHVARIVGWSFAIWGAALYWYAGVLYALHVRQLARAGGMDDATAPPTPSAPPGPPGHDGPEREAREASV
jgi:CDP-diacylglycerol--glycerol-3-phosphate 3-phosphatidyltransferase